MKIEIKIEPTFSIKWPKLRLSLNNKLLFDDYCMPSSDDKDFVWSHIVKDESLLQRNELKIEHYDKDGRETVLDKNGEVLSDRSLILKSIQIAGHKVPDVVLFDKAFLINWTPKQLTENKDRPNSIKNNLYFGYNGIYKYCFGNNGAKHYFENLIEKERLANISNKKEIVGVDGKIVEAFEFTGKLVDGAQKVAIDITDLYHQVKNAN